MVPFFVAKHPEIQYTGVVTLICCGFAMLQAPKHITKADACQDVVSDVIARNKQRHPGVNFLSQDLSLLHLMITFPAHLALLFGAVVQSRGPVGDSSAKGS